MDLRRDRFNSTAIFTVVLVAILAMALNCPYQYIPTETRFWQANFAFNSLYDSPEVSYVQYAEGGFPWTWVSNKPNFPDHHYQYLWANLTFNIAFWTVAAATISFMVARFRKHTYRPWSWASQGDLSLHRRAY